MGFYQKRINKKNSKNAYLISFLVLIIIKNQQTLPVRVFFYTQIHPNQTKQNATKSTKKN